VLPHPLNLWGRRVDLAVSKTRVVRRKGGLGRKKNNMGS